MDLPAILSALLRKPSQWSHFFTLQTFSSGFTAVCFYRNMTTVSSSVLDTDATSPEDSGDSQSSSPGDAPVALPPGLRIGTFVFCGGLFFSGLLYGGYKTLTLPRERGFPYLQCTSSLPADSPPSGNDGGPAWALWEVGAGEAGGGGLLASPWDQLAAYLEPWEASSGS